MHPALLASACACVSSDGARRIRWASWVIPPELSAAIAGTAGRATPSQLSGAASQATPARTRARVVRRAARRIREGFVMASIGEREGQEPRVERAVRESALLLQAVPAEVDGGFGVHVTEPVAGLQRG